jgi:hypothetical protein
MHEPFKTLSVTALQDVGGFILTWGQLETQLTVAITEMQPGCAGPHVSENRRMLQAVIRKWFTVYCETTASGIPKAKEIKSRLEAGAILRNILAHGADNLWFDDDGYVINCFERFHQNAMTGNFPPQRTFRQSELSDAAAEVLAMRREIIDLTALALSRPRKLKARKATK